MSSNQFGDPRFPRARCDICNFLCILEQTDQYKVTRLADESSKIITACKSCGAAGAPSFTFEKLEG